MRVLVLGAGGIGGYFGGRLAQEGVDVTFLVRAARAARLASGLIIESPLADAKVKVATATTVDVPYDLVLLSCKAYDLDDAIVAIGPAVGEQTIILPLLNGIAHLDRLDAAFGAVRTIGGLAHISVTLGEGGEIRHLNKLQKLTYGPRDAAQQDACAKLTALFEKASFDTRSSKNVVQEMWEKFAFITAAGAIACLMRAATGAIVAATDGELLVKRMLAECNAVAAASGFPVSQKAQDWATPFLTDKSSEFKPSMLADLERGGRIEADHLQGDMIRRGAAHGVPTELLEIALCNLQAYEAQRAA